MKKLLLLRHARAQHAEIGKTDHERSLAPEGEKAAKHLGRQLAKQRALPGFAIFSTAKRAAETFLCLEKGAETEIPASGEDWLYHATPHDIMQHLKHLPEEADSVLIVGHNPALHTLAVELAGNQPLAASISSSFPPCTLTVFEFDAKHWHDVSKKNATFTFLIFPKE